MLVPNTSIYDYVRQAIEEGNIEIEYCPTEVMVADLYNKTTNQGTIFKD